MKKQIIIGSVLGLVAVIIVAILFFRGGFQIGTGNQEVSTAAPVDIVLDFYEPWLQARQSTSTDPYASGLADSPILSKELRKRLADAKGQPQTELDPVLCQTKLPQEISARPVNESENQSQVLVVSREEGVTDQAIITLLRHNDGWYINDITCAPGEFAPEREFSFENEGYLLKSVVPPLDSKYWHLVFTQNGEQGHVVPLFFHEDSVCIAPDGTESICVPDQFTEPSKAVVHGQMTEMGVDVKRLELKEE